MQIITCMSSHLYSMIETHLRLSPQWRSLELLNGHELQALQQRDPALAKLAETSAQLPILKLRANFSYLMHDLETEAHRQKNRRNAYLCLHQPTKATDGPPGMTICYTVG
jgi:hypothetical protein